MLVVSPSSQGICATILLGETIISGERIPLKYTWLPPRSVGSGLALAGAEAVWNATDNPAVAWIASSEPGAIDAASPPPESVDPPVTTEIWTVVAVDAAVSVTEYVVALPSVPDSREVSSTWPVDRSGAA